MRWCVLVLAVTVSTALAGPDQKAQLFARPSRDGAPVKARAEGEAEIEGVVVRVGVDRRLVGTGENVQLALAASQRVTVAVVVVGPITESDVDTLAIHGRTNVPLEAGRTMPVPVRLDGVRGAAYTPFDAYSILVVSRTTADTLEAAQHADRDAFEGMVRTLRVTPTAIDAFAHARSSAIAIAMPDTAERDAPFTVAVTVTNTTTEPIDGMAVSLHAAAGLSGKDVTMSPMFGHSITLAPGRSTRVEFLVSGLRSGVMGLAARLDWIGEHVAGVEPLVRGAFDAIEIVPAARDLLPSVSKR